MVLKALVLHLALVDIILRVSALLALAKTGIINLLSPGRHSSWELEFRDCGAIPGRGLLLTAEIRVEAR